MKQLLIYLLIYALSILSLRAQTYSLIEAQNYSIENSYMMKNSQIDLTIAKKKIWETTSIGLPQVVGSIQYQNMLDIPTTLLPDFISPSIYGVLAKEGVVDKFGNPIVPPSTNTTQFFPAKFGTQHNANYGITISQLIFNGQYIVGLQASKVFYQMSEENYEKSAIDIKFNVANSYYIILILNQNVEILKKSLATIHTTVSEAEQTYQQGFIDEITVDQLKINLITLQNAISLLEWQTEVSKRLLKFQMGIDIEEPIKLTDSLGMFINTSLLQPAEAIDYELESLIDYKIITTQEKLQKLNYRRQLSEYLPTIAGFYTYKKSAMRDEFDIFEKGKDWFPTSVIGINIDIPIFSSGSRYSKSQQAKLNYQKIQNTKQQIVDGLKLEISQAKTNYNTAVEKFKREKTTKELALKIYEKNLIKFKQGVATSTELTQIYSQYLNAETNYHNSIMELLLAKLKFDKALGKI